MTPLSARDRELLAMPTIASQLPVYFSNGNGWLEFDGYCSLCEGQIPSDRVHGAVLRPIDSVIVVEAIGACPKCRTGTRFFARMHSDLRMSFMKGGKWLCFHPKRSNWLSRFLRSLTGLFR